MAECKFYTIGVYGKTENEFFDSLINNKIDTFCDIRRRRGVRGAHYAFVNSAYLQKKLASLGIKYLYVADLTPTEEIRELQKSIDKANGIPTTRREVISPEMSAEYKKQILAKFNFNSFFDVLQGEGTKRAAFFCVEGNYKACHRSVLAEHLAKKYNYPVKHL